MNFCGGHHFRLATRTLLCAAGRMRGCRPQRSPECSVDCSEAAGRVGSQAADYPGLKKLQTNGCVLSADTAEHIADMAADGGFTFRRATATVAEG